MSMGIVMFVLGLAVPVLIREPATGRYTPANKVRPGSHAAQPHLRGKCMCQYSYDFLHQCMQL